MKLSKLSKFLKIVILIFFLFNNYVYGEKIISFNPRICEFLDIYDGFPSTTNDSISYYTIRYAVDDIEYIVMKNSLSENIFVPFGNKISIEIFDDENIYCNVSKEFNFEENDYPVLKEIEIKKINDYIQKEQDKQNFSEHYEKFDLGYYLLILILIILLSFIFSFLILYNRNSKRKKYF